MNPELSTKQDQSPQGILPPVLAYAPPVAIHATTVEADATTGTLRFDLGPMPTSMFVQLVVPAALLLGIFATMLAAFVTHPRSIGLRDGFAIAMLMGVLGTGIWIWQIARHRGVPRILEARGGQLLYQSPLSARTARSLDARTIYKLRVRCDAIRPWLWILEAMTAPSPILSLKSSKPFLLTRHNNRKELRDIARRLSTALGLPH